jgi:hypothetical protein
MARWLTSSTTRRSLPRKYATAVVATLHRDYLVRVFTNDYFVDPVMIDLLVDVRASLDTVTVTHEGLVLASHERVWAKELGCVPQRMLLLMSSDFLCWIRLS